MPFKSIRERTFVYQSRKKCKNAALFLDLTKRRLEILFWTKEVIKNKPKIEFAFADINFNIGAKVKSGSLFFLTLCGAFFLPEARGNHPISRYSANQIAPFQPRDTGLAVRSEFLSTLTKVEMATKLP